MTLTWDQTVKTLREIVSDFGEDFAYRNDAKLGKCTYGNEDGEPDCIVGHLLSRIAPDTFRAFIQFEESNGSFGVTDGDFEHDSFGDDELVDLDYVPFPTVDAEDSVKQLLDRVQHDQDRGVPWGNAVESNILFLTATKGN